MALPNGISGLHCVGVGLLVIGLVLHVVGLATPNWMTISTISSTQGLWTTCHLNTCTDGISIPGTSDELKAAGAFAILAMLAGIGGLGLACLHIARRIKAEPDLDILKLGHLAAGMAALVCVIISCSVFGAGIYKNIAEIADIGFSLILSAVGGVIICIGSVMFYAACNMKS
ncbi:epithelial membrane protein 1 [Biomphalaria pfeifferi]|uniref:Epithelial membrane protein 1 n=1 Tax=Biomphalaria pfeifferi TaxID=112525 RepID=A0AAD8C617_BIOPF|nr:epithelial membrane protein 1 [Biomphalaria pfeifferi]